MNIFIVFKRKHFNVYDLFAVDCENHLLRIEFGKPYILKSISIEERLNPYEELGRKRAQRKDQYINVNFYDNTMTEFNLNCLQPYFNKNVEYELI